MKEVSVIMRLDLYRQLQFKFSAPIIVVAETASVF